MSVWLIVYGFIGLIFAGLSFSYWEAKENPSWAGALLAGLLWIVIVPLAVG